MAGDLAVGRGNKPAGDVTIQGQAGSSGITIARSGPNDMRRFQGGVQGTLTLNDLTLTGGRLPNGWGGMVNGVNGNILGVDPRLGPLADNGGPTPTVANAAATSATLGGTVVVESATAVTGRVVPKSSPKAMIRVTGHCLRDGWWGTTVAAWQRSASPCPPNRRKPP